MNAIHSSLQAQEVESDGGIRGFPSHRRYGRAALGKDHLPMAHVLVAIAAGIFFVLANVRTLNRSGPPGGKNEELT